MKMPSPDVSGILLLVFTSKRYSVQQVPGSLKACQNYA